MRSGYSDDLDMKELAMYRGRVASATRGKRGQKLLRDLLAALDAMPDKRLVRDELVDGAGDVCLLGAGGRHRQLSELHTIDPHDHDHLGRVFDVSPCLIAEIEFVNDDDYGGGSETPERRYTRVREWVVKNIKSGASA